MQWNVASEKYTKCEKGENMAISYNKLWKLLIDKNMKKMELRQAAGISTNAMAKLGNNRRTG